MRHGIRIVVGAAAFLLAIAAYAGGTGEGAVATDAAEPSAVSTGRYQEAPMLQALVQAGELPPVAERLPPEPLVVQPYAEIGKYGGTLTTGDTRPGGFGVDTRPLYETFFKQHFPNYSDVSPNLATGFAFSGGANAITVTLREGVRWSDGTPFTADDVVFYYEAEFTNETLMPVKKAMWVAGGHPMTMEKVDDLTFRISWPVANGLVRSYLGGSHARQGLFYMPRHHVSKYHIDYNADANSLAKEEGFETWDKLFTFKKLPRNGGPTVSAYVLEESSAERAVAVRNPYYWKVDTAGNQLPYIDRWVEKEFANPETRTVALIAGDLDFGAGLNDLANMPLYRQNEEQGGYRTLLYPTDKNGGVYALNETYNGEHADLLRPLFRDRQFRRALSLAINRDEINQLVYLGLARPSQATVLPSVSFYEQRWGDNYAAYDPDQANAMLDEIGLDERDADGFRLLPNGEPLFLLIESCDACGVPVKVHELVTQYWREVGVKTDLKMLQKARYDQRTREGQVQVTAHQASGMDEPTVWWRTIASGYMFGSPHRLLTYGHEYTRWRNSNGAQGEAPPESFQTLYDTLEQWRTVEYGSADYERLGRELFELHYENLWMIGTVQQPPHPIIVSNKLRNVPVDEDGIWAVGPIWVQALLQDQWYFE